MSGKKQVIHVKDLVIKADNVYVERGKGKHGQDQHTGDSFFGSQHEREESVRRESPDEQQHHKENESGEQEERRRPFDWF